MMKYLKLFVFSIFMLLVFSTCKQKAEPVKPSYALVIHGGSGNFSADDIPLEKQEKYKEKLKEALLAGEAILKDGGTSLDAVETCIKILEDSPLFNAGKGSVFTHDGTNEMDASIMNGADLNAGAVAGVMHIKNPISAARAVMEKSKHVMLSGSGADMFAAQNGLDTVSAEYFFTEKRWESLQKFLKNENDKSLDKLGTVGCVALDKNGNLAAGTSTGGMTNKRFGRIGDSPIIGCGSYANSKTCGISFTGHGEYIIRSVAAYDIAALMEYKQMDLASSMHEVIHTKLKNIGGNAGAIGIDKNGNIEMMFNTTAMFRGCLKAGAEPMIFIGN
jgi:beta-aspartyl-peptidase (threonine type)